MYISVNAHKCYVFYCRDTFEHAVHSARGKGEKFMQNIIRKPQKKKLRCDTDDIIKTMLEKVREIDYTV